MKIIVLIARLFSYCIAKMTYKRRIAFFLGVRLKQVDRIYKEIGNSGLMREIVTKAGLKKGFFNFSMFMVLRAPTLYVLCRLFKPEIVIETGVADGFSSAFILNALALNNKGHLYSIDLPNQPGQELRVDRVTGWLVPEDLRNRWTLLIGSSREKLPALLSDLKRADIFYHDSDHSYANMMFELAEAKKYLIPEGIFIVDDITDNSAFTEFCKDLKLDSIKLFKTGLIKNESKRDYL